jgi:hypothetical protein
MNRELIARVEAIDSPPRVVLDMDSTEIPVYGQQEQSAYNGHFASTCYHPLLLFKREGDCLAAKLRPGNVHSAEGWEELLLPEIERQRKQGKEGAFRADAAFAKPEIYEALEARGVKYVIRLPANANLERAMGELLPRPPGRPSCSGLQTAARGLANNVDFEPTILANESGLEPTFQAHEPTFRASSLQTAGWAHIRCQQDQRCMRQ